MMYDKMRELNVSYARAAHGVQSAVFYEMTQKLGVDPNASQITRMLKHLRTGVDMRAADHMGLVALLMKKGVITEAEYLEAMRRAANEELARYTEHVCKTYNVNVSFG